MGRRGKKICAVKVEIKPGEEEKIKARALCELSKRQLLSYALSVAAIVGHGGKGRKLRDHIYNHKHKLETESWEWGGVMKSQRPAPADTPPARPHLLKHRQLGNKCPTIQSHEGHFSFKAPCTPSPD